MAFQGFQGLGGLGGFDQRGNNGATNKSDGQRADGGVSLTPGKGKMIEQSAVKRSSKSFQLGAVPEGERRDSIGSLVMHDRAADHRLYPSPASPTGSVVTAINTNDRDVQTRYRHARVMSVESIDSHESVACSTSPSVIGGERDASRHPSGVGDVPRDPRRTSYSVELASQAATRVAAGTAERIATNTADRVARNITNQHQLVNNNAMQQISNDYAALHTSQTQLQQTVRQNHTYLYDNHQALRNLTHANSHSSRQSIDDLEHNQDMFLQHQDVLRQNQQTLDATVRLLQRNELQQANQNAVVQQVQEQHDARLNRNEQALNAVLARIQWLEQSHGITPSSNLPVPQQGSPAVNVPAGHFNFHPTPAGQPAAHAGPSTGPTRHSNSQSGTSTDQAAPNNHQAGTSRTAPAFNRAGSSNPAGATNYLYAGLGPVNHAGPANRAGTVNHAGSPNYAGPVNGRGQGNRQRQTNRNGVTTQDTIMQAQTPGSRAPANASDDVFSTSNDAQVFFMTGDAQVTPRTFLAQFAKKGITELLSSQNTKNELFVRQFCTEPLTGHQLTKMIPEVVRQSKEHLDHAKMGFKVLEDMEFRKFAVTGVLGRWIVQNLYDVPLLDQFLLPSGSPLGPEFASMFYEEIRMATDTNDVDDYPTRFRLNMERANLAETISALPGFQKWLQDKAWRSTSLVFSLLSPLVKKSEHGKAFSSLNTALLEAVRIAARMRTELKIYEASWYRYGARWEAKYMVQRTPGLEGQACDEEPSPHCVRLSTGPHVYVKSFVGNTGIQRDIAIKGEVILCPRLGNLQ